MSIAYAQMVNAIKRDWDTVSREAVSKAELEDTALASLIEWAQGEEDCADVSIETGITGCKLTYNLLWAARRDNKFLLSENILDFPTMNYVLKEGPYMPPQDAQFGPEDKQIIMEGDSGNLVFFQPEIDGLERGIYVECLL